MLLFEDDCYWVKTRDGDPVVFEIFSRHYSFRKWRSRKGIGGKRIVGPGERIVLKGKDGRAIFIWRKAKFRMDGQIGIECTVFRNEGDQKSSIILDQAEDIAQRRWPGERLFTYVDTKEVKSNNPGYCYKVNGWRRCGISKRKKLIILEKVY